MNYNSNPSVSTTQIKIASEIIDERTRQINLAHGGDTIEFDKHNTPADWSSYICYYASRSNEGLFKGHKDFRGDMVKVAALAMAAIEAVDDGYILKRSLPQLQDGATGDGEEPTSDTM